jgi:hypothetical protein
MKDRDEQRKKNEKWIKVFGLSNWMDRDTAVNDGEE